MKLRFTPRATRDLAEIGDYVRQFSPQAALRVRAAILESLQSLILFPNQAEAIVILAIQHPAREREHSDT